MPYKLGQGAKDYRISNGKIVTGIPIPWGDLAAAERSTGIPNVTTYMNFPTLPGLGVMSPAIFKLLSCRRIRNLVGKMIDKTVTGPDEHTRQTVRSYLWACATAADGQQKEAWLETRANSRVVKFLPRVEVDQIDHKT